MTRRVRDKQALQPRVLILLAAFGVPAAAEGQDQAARPLPVDPLVTVGTLPNGMRFYVRQNAEPRNRAELRLVVRAGSVLEDDDQQGLAHFTEHMAFNGTRHFAKQQLVDYLEGVGMRMGPDLNAYTSFDETVYMLQIPTDTPSVVRTAFQVLEDWAHQVTFEGDEVDKERGVVIEEWRLGQGAGARLRDQQFPIIFKDSRYAERLPIGKKEILEAFPHDAVRRFYRDWYRPDLQAVIAVGDFDPAAIEALIREHLGRVPARPDPRTRPAYDVPDHAEPLFAIATDKEATGTSVSVLFKQAPRDHSTHAAYRQDIVEGLFSAMLNARLFELSQQADPPFLGGSGGRGRLIGAKEVFSLGASVREGGVVRGLDALLTEAERVAQFGFTTNELERATTRRLRGLERSFAERGKTDSRVHASEYIRAFLQHEPIPGIERELSLHREYLPTITLDEVNRLARAWITPHNRVVVVSAPEQDSVPVPTPEELGAVFERVRGKAITAYTDTLRAGSLVATPPAPGRVVSEHAIPELGVTEWTLSNGIQVVLKPTDFKADEVLVQAISPGGTSLVPDERYLSASFATAIVGASGAGGFSAVDLQKVTAGKVARVGPSIGAYEEGVSGSASPRDLGTLFELLYLYLTSPRLDSGAVAAMRARLETFARNRGASPEAHFSDTLQVTMSQASPRSWPLTPERVARMDPRDALEFYRDRFADMGDFTFFFVGNLQPDSLKPLVETWLGALPAHGREETWVDRGIRPPAGVVRKTVRKGLEPRARTQFIFTGGFEDSHENRYVLRSMGEALQIRLREVLREDMGGVYGVGVGASSSTRPDTSCSVSLGFGSDPARLEELVDSAFAVIRSFQETGPSDSIVQKVQEAQRRQRETSLRQNGYWMGQLVAYRRQNLDPRNLLEFEARIAGLTAAKIRDAARRYIRMDNYVRVTLVPEQ